MAACGCEHTAHVLWQTMKHIWTIFSLCFSRVSSCRALDAHTNFERFWFAMLTLFRVATADNWSDVFRGCMVKVSPRGGSDRGKEGHGGAAGRGGRGNHRELFLFLFLRWLAVLPLALSFQPFDCDPNAVNCGTPMVDCGCC